MRDREEAQQRLMRGDRTVVVATNAFGLGIDKPDTRYVAHWNFPACGRCDNCRSGLVARASVPQVRRPDAGPVAAAGEP